MSISTYHRPGLSGPQGPHRGIVRHGSPGCEPVIGDSHSALGRPSWQAALLSHMLSPRDSHGLLIRRSPPRPPPTGREWWSPGRSGPAHRARQACGTRRLPAPQGAHPVREGEGSTLRHGRTLPAIPPGSAAAAWTARAIRRQSFLPPGNTSCPCTAARNCCSLIAAITAGSTETR